METYRRSRRADEECRTFLNSEAVGNFRGRDVRYRRVAALPSKLLGWPRATVDTRPIRSLTTRCQSERSDATFHANWAHQSNDMGPPKKPKKTTNTSSWNEQLAAGVWLPQQLDKRPAKRTYYMYTRSIEKERERERAIEKAKCFCFV